ncbi:uncharacterized protein LOC118435925 [Folsomia candida]|uniref:uncharacterized protein LOC118435925 n=1 Tax=Folsomia candida TaxID=158441 RepID=UPI001604DC6F|nr:uncharacterized protein LOC118435925 [Folsomia candida]
MGPPKPMYYRNKKKTNWELYAKLVKPKLSTMDGMEISSTEEIDMHVDRIVRVLKEGFDEACPLKLVKPRKRVIPWWSRELDLLRKSTRTHWKVYIADKSKDSWEAYCVVRNRYIYALRTAKRDSWRTYCGEIESTHETSRLHRVLKNDQVNRLGRIQDTNGGYTVDVKQSLQVLIEKHYPPDPKGAERGMSLTVETTARIDSYVNPELVEKAIKSFGPYKAAGVDDVFPKMLQVVSFGVSGPPTTVMRACLQHGYTPRPWRETKVIFIPKP